MARPPHRPELAALLLLASAGAAPAQPAGEAGLHSDVTITGSVLEPSPLDVADDAALAAMLAPAEGAQVQVFARDLVNPRMLAVSEAGILYATRRSLGDVVMLKDADGDGRAEAPVTVASRPGGRPSQALQGSLGPRRDSRERLAVVLPR